MSHPSTEEYDDPFVDVFASKPYIPPPPSATRPVEPSSARNPVRATDLLSAANRTPSSTRVAQSSPNREEEEEEYNLPAEEEEEEMEHRPLPPLVAPRSIGRQPKAQTPQARGYIDGRSTHRLAQTGPLRPRTAPHDHYARSQFSRTTPQLTSTPMRPENETVSPRLTGSCRLFSPDRHGACRGSVYGSVCVECGREQTMCPFCATVVPPHALFCPECRLGVATGRQAGLVNPPVDTLDTADTEGVVPEFETTHVETSQPPPPPKQTSAGGAYLSFTLFVERVWDKAEQLSYNLKLWVSVMLFFAIASTIAGAVLDGQWSMVINGVAFILLSLAGIVVVWRRISAMAWYYFHVLVITCVVCVILAFVGLIVEASKPCTSTKESCDVRIYAMLAGGMLSMGIVCFVYAPVAFCARCFVDDVEKEEAQKRAALALKMKGESSV